MSLSRYVVARHVRKGTTHTGRCISRLSTTEIANTNFPVDLHPEVQDALVAGKPVVSLETALVTHGLPYPTNLELGLDLEKIVRSTGSVPATIGMINGRMKVGLERSELERLADPKRKRTKISRRDIAAAITMKADGGTTCATTLIFSALAGIKVFSTGGLGGVHRGGERSMDISADLQELTRCPVGLVSAGVKSILDIGRTLEYLETLGVPVIAYGETCDFPAFFSRKSGFTVPWNVADPRTAAQLLHSQWQLGIESGALLAVPIPQEYEARGAAIQKFVEQAVAESEANGMSKRGKEVTPWLLARVAELTKGDSLESNLALLRNTALVGGHIAGHYAQLDNNEPQSKLFTPASLEIESVANIGTPLDTTSTTEDITLPPADLIVIGSAAIDITAQADSNTDANLGKNSTAPGKVTVTMGGVARNIAEAAHRILTAEQLPSSTLLLAPTGEDAFGKLLVDETDKLGMRTDGLLKSDKRTAACDMVLDSTGNLVGGVADMAITHSLVDEQIISQLRKHIPKIVALDGNLSPSTIQSITTYCDKHNIKTFFEPTSVIKSTAILPAIESLLSKPDITLPPITFFSPNLSELVHIYNTVQTDNLSSSPYWWSCINSMGLGASFRMDVEQLARRNVTDLDVTKGNLSFLVDQGVAQMAINLLPFFQHIIIKCGDRGAIIAMLIDSKEALTSHWGREKSNPQGRWVVAQGNNKEIVVLQHFPGLTVENVVNVTGAGDSFVGTILASLSKNPQAFYDPKGLEQTVTTAQQAAVLTLQSELAVSPLISDSLKLQSSAI